MFYFYLFLIIYLSIIIQNKNKQQCKFVSDLEFKLFMKFYDE